MRHSCGDRNVPARKQRYDEQEVAKNHDASHHPERPNVPDGAERSAGKRDERSDGRGEHGRRGTVVGPREACLQRPTYVRRLERRLLPRVHEHEDVVRADAHDDEERVVHQVRGVRLIHHEVVDRQADGEGDDDLEDADERDKKGPRDDGEESEDDEDREHDPVEVAVEVHEQVGSSQHVLGGPNGTN